MADKNNNEKWFVIDEECDHKQYKTEEEALTAAKRAVHGKRYNNDTPYVVYEAKHRINTLVPESVVSTLS